MTAIKVYSNEYVLGILKNKVKYILKFIDFCGRLKSINSVLIEIITF